jgi:hypothetical protein
MKTLGSINLDTYDFFLAGRFGGALRCRDSLDMAAWLRGFAGACRNARLPRDRS